MIEVLVFMSGGILLGYLIRDRHQTIKVIEKLIMWCIFLLLFLLGLWIGRDPLIMSNLPSLGLTALVLSLGGIAGSVLLALLLWKLYFKHKQ